MSKKKITIIAPSAFGYSNYILGALKGYDQLDAGIIYLDSPVFFYKNVFHRLHNVLSKLFLNNNLKKSFVSKRILKYLNDHGEQDIVFIIRPDILDNKTLEQIRKLSKFFVAYYWDSIKRFPRKATILYFFDKVYSYDKNDVENYKLFFLNNYIFNENIVTVTPEFLFFNISTNDYRLPFLENLTAYIAQKGWSKKILVYNGSEMPTKHVKLITKQKPTKDVASLISKCKIIIEIQRVEQIGLSFRVFEALGQRKKLITTNKDIVSYDFYNPQNILVIDQEHIIIPSDFVDSSYVDVPDEILAPYRIENWVKNILLS